MTPVPGRPSSNLPPPDFVVPVIEFYKERVDRKVLRENLKLTTNERSQQFERNMEVFYELRCEGLVTDSVTFAELQMIARRRGE